MTVPTIQRGTMLKKAQTENGFVFEKDTKRENRKRLGDMGMTLETRQNANQQDGWAFLRLS
jgi:hypothetical protein